MREKLVVVAEPRSQFPNLGHRYLIENLFRSLLSRQPAGANRTRRQKVGIPFVMDQSIADALIAPKIPDADHQLIKVEARHAGRTTARSPGLCRLEPSKHRQ